MKFLPGTGKQFRLAACQVFKGGNTLTVVINSRRRALSALAASILYAPALAGGHFQQGPVLYTLGAPAGNIDVFNNACKLMGLQPVLYHGVWYALSGNAIVGYWSNNRFSVSPNLPAVRGAAPDPQTADTLAQTFAAGAGLIPKDPSVFTPRVDSTWANQQMTLKNGGTPRQDVIRSVRLVRSLNGTPVYGMASVINVDVGASGIVGATENVRSAAPVPNFAPVWKSKAVVYNEYRQQASALGTGTYALQYTTLAFFDQNKRFIQPCYIYAVQLTGPKGQRSANFIVIPALANSPEPSVSLMGPMGQTPNNGSPPPMAPQSAQLTVPQRFGGPSVLDALLAPAAQANPVRVGMYVVRNDDGCWQSDAWSFWTHVSPLQWGQQPRSLSQYYWDDPWMWENTATVPDNSMWFPGQCHMVMMEGHGAPWNFTCLRNNANFVDLPLCRGFGASEGFGEVTAFVAFHSCDVIPAPGDPHGGDYTSGSTWDVWWHMFQGTRGYYGYRTTMAICDGVGGDFGDKLDHGEMVCSAWLDSTGGQWWYHFWSGWDYGSIVIASGHDGDTLFTNAPIPPAGSLSAWWQH